MKKELNYLSIPDYFNKLLLVNFNQKPKFNKNISLQYKLSKNNHLGSAFKAIYLLEMIFPKKAFVLKLTLKKKKLYFGQKSRNNIFFTFSLNLSSLQFIDFYRFFSVKPLSLKKTKIEQDIIINKKLKQFELNNNLLLLFNDLESSFRFLHLYHLN